MESEHRNNSTHCPDPCAIVQTDLSSHISGSDHHRIYSVSERKMKENIFTKLPSQNSEYSLQAEVTHSKYKLYTNI